MRFLILLFLLSSCSFVNYQHGLRTERNKIYQKCIDNGNDKHKCDKKSKKVIKNFRYKVEHIQIK